MTAPTEAEIRVAILEHAHWPTNDQRDQLADVIDEIANAIGDPAFSALHTDEWGTDGNAGQSEGPWTDLRPSEAYRLDALVKEAKERALERAEAVIVDELVTAGVLFAEEFPNAPRPKEAVTP